MDIRYRYNGTEFHIREYHPDYERPYAEIVGLLSHGDEVFVPSTVNGCEIRGLRLYGGYNYDVDMEAYSYGGVRRLVLPSGLMILSLYNDNFPDLEEIVFSEPQSAYTFSEGMLYDRGGKRLLLTFKRGRQAEEIRVSRKTEQIGAEAFKNTTVRKITFANPDISVEGNPFERSVWFDSHKESGDTLYVGNMVFRHFSRDELVLDPSIERISPYCFEYAYPEALTTHFIPSDNIMDALNRGGCRRLTITSDCRIPWESLRKWSCLRTISLPVHSTYMDIDGVVFDKKRNELVFYPPDRAMPTIQFLKARPLLGAGRL